MSARDKSVAFSGNSNPLLNPVVLDNLFKVCDVSSKDLCEFRLVSKQWHSLSLATWRSQATLLVFEDPQDYCPSSSLICKRWHEIMSIDSLLGLIKDDKDKEYYHLSDKPFSRFHLQKWRLRDGILRGAFGVGKDLTIPAVVLQRSFWTEVGRWMKKLMLDQCSISYLNSLRELMFRDTPVLEELVISSCVFEKNCDQLGKKAEDEGYPPQMNLKSLNITGGEWDPVWPLPWNEILSVFQNMRSITLVRFENPLAVRGSALTKLLVAIGWLKQTGIHSALKHMDIMNISIPAGITKPIADLFDGAALRLETLKIHFGADTPESVVSQLMSQCSATLRTLHCRKDMDSPAPYSNNWLGGDGGGLIFEHLEELQIHGPMAPNLSFLQHTPNLKVLRFTGTNYNSFDPIFERELRLEELSVLETDCRIENRDKFGRIATSMPNLTVLNVPLNPTNFSVVVTSVWKDTLKELWLPAESTIGDEELSGFRLGGVMGIPPPSKRPPNITNLSVLQKFFQPEEEDFRSPVFLSNQTARHGFLLLPNLKSLHIFVEDEFPSSTLAALKDKIPDLVVLTKENWFNNRL